MHRKNSPDSIAKNGFFSLKKSSYFSDSILSADKEYFAILDQELAPNHFLI